MVLYRCIIRALLYRLCDEIFKEEKLMKKRIISSILALAMIAASFVGCGNTTEVVEETKTPAPQETKVETKVETKEEAPKYDKSVDFLVIGAGGAGLSAAIEASDHGVKDVLIVEKLPTIGGTTFISQGMIAGFDSKVQKAEPSKPTNFDEMYNNLMNNASWRLDPKLAKVTVGNCGKTIDWLVDRLAMPFEDDVLVGYGPLEMMHVVKGAGAGMLKPFQDALDKAGIEVMTETTATEILTDEKGTPVAVKVKGKDGEKTIGAKAIMIATGGYANNPELTARLDPEFEGTFGIGFGSCTGDGLIMANNIGAAITHTHSLMAVLKDYEIMAEHNGNSGTASISAFIGRAKNLIMVGKEGKRFTDEMAKGYMSQDLNSPIFDQMHKDELGYVWAISDEATVVENKLKRGLDMEFIKANTVEELAEKMDVDAEGLKATIADYNKSASANRPALTAPYVAVAVVPCEIITYGGVARNEWGEVIRADGTVIPALYVAGEASANSAYMGFTISNALTWGRIAGESAADYIQGKEKRTSPAAEFVTEKVVEEKVRFDMSKKLNDGEYEATVKGQEGDLKVKTVVKDGKISNVEILEQHETEAVAKGALETMPKNIAEANSVDIDAVSGATLTSNRILDAVAECLAKAAA